MVMEHQFTIAEARSNLPSIIDTVEKGPIVRLTRHGRTVAVLLSIQEYDRLRRKRAGLWRALKAFRSRIKDEGVEVSGKDFEGLRDPSPGREVELS
jgi:antitoxin Phd